MKKIAVVALLAISSSAMANNGAGCGVGSAIFNGQRGIAPQVLALTVNGTFMNSVGITFGTSGCTQDGVVSSSWKISMFIDGSRVALSRDAAAGQGENLDALAAMMDVKADDRAEFVATIKGNFNTVFADDKVAANLKDVLAANTRLAGYAALI